MKTTIKACTSGQVTISYDNRLTGERITREFSCGFKDGAYVVELDRKGGSRQVCDGLSHSGSTLTSPKGRDGLIDVIRREYRAMRRSDAKFFAS